MVKDSYFEKTWKKDRVWVSNFFTGHEQELRETAMHRQACCENTARTVVRYLGCELIEKYFMARIYM